MHSRTHVALFSKRPRRKCATTCASVCETDNSCGQYTQTSSTHIWCQSLAFLRATDFSLCTIFSPRRPYFLEVQPGSTFGAIEPRHWTGCLRRFCKEFYIRMVGSTQVAVGRRPVSDLGCDVTIMVGVQSTTVAAIKPRGRSQGARWSGLPVLVLS